MLHAPLAVPACRFINYRFLSLGSVKCHLFNPVGISFNILAFACLLGTKKCSKRSFKSGSSLFLNFCWCSYTRLYNLCQQQQHWREHEWKVILSVHIFWCLNFSIMWGVKRKFAVVVEMPKKSSVVVVACLQAVSCVDDWERVRGEKYIITINDCTAYEKINQRFVTTHRSECIIMRYFHVFRIFIFRSMCKSD
jgi:hypothetical protein